MLAFLGALCRERGLRKEADRAFARFDRLTQGKADYRRERSLFLVGQGGELPGALRLAHADHAQRQDVFARDALAWALSANGRHREAKTAMDRALGLGTRSAQLFYHAGVIHHRLGERQKAGDYLSRALGLNPHFHPSEARKARILIQEAGGRRQEAGGRRRVP